MHHPNSAESAVLSKCAICFTPQRYSSMQQFMQQFVDLRTIQLRLPEEIRINNYNPLLLMLWKANIDLQYIGESSLDIARYVTGYVTKAERSKMQDLWQEVSCLHLQQAVVLWHSQFVF